MNIYAPQTEIKSPWKDYILIFLGFWFAAVGVLAWWANYLFFTTKEISTEWTAEEKSKSLDQLVEKAISEGVVESSPEAKMRALQGIREESVNDGGL